jgi:anti-sigma28 factor (negative regulator of flagellin synthesis)
MEISSHNVSFVSQHSSSSLHVQRERLEVWTGENPNRSQVSNGEGPSSTPDASQLVEPDRVEVDTSPPEESSETDEESSDNPKTQEELELEILLQSVSVFLKGTNLEFQDPGSDDIREAYEEGNERIEAIEDGKTSLDDPGQAEELIRNQNEENQPNWGLEYNRHEHYEEQESLSFQAEGTVKTADGKNISFDVSLNMERKFVRESSTEIRAGNAEVKDPLVINYDGNAADLSEDRFEFDLDMDGTMESLNTLETGSGFLAYEKNNNGEIDDGSELFGPSTGNGFEELATYDRDGNRFIDENDPIYEDLYVMKPTSDGSMESVSADQLDVGAIFLGSSETSFSFKNGLDLQAELRRSGIYLKENGEAGTVQQIDLAARENSSSGSRSTTLNVAG